MLFLAYKEERKLQLMYLLEELQNDTNSSRRKMNMEEGRCKKKPWTMYVKNEICM